MPILALFRWQAGPDALAAAYDRAERAEKNEPIPRGREQRLELCHRRLAEDGRTEHEANRAYQA